MKRRLSILLFLLIATYFATAQTYELNDTINIPGITVNGSYSATRTTPFTFQNLSKTTINLSAQNNEPAILLSRTTPSISTYSESGSGMGYMYFRLRGIDQTRINSTFNGVPLNEPEDQGIYYNNYSGLLNSLSSIQVIRGVGISKPGVSSYGGSINFSPQEFAKKLSGHAQFVYGSNNTGQVNAGINSKNFFINGSVSTTDGYKEHTHNHSWSTFYGATKKYKQSEFFLYGFIGHQLNGMGWLGETLDSIHKNPRYNSNSPAEKDNFTQVHNQAIWKYKGFSTTIYYTYLLGKYGVNSGLTQTYIDTINVHSGWLGANLNYLIPVSNTVSLNVGLNSYTYKRHHFGTNNFINGAAYDNTGTKNGYSPYLKGEFNYSQLSIYGDAQYRHIKFSYVGDATFPTKYYNFLDWSGGTTYALTDNLRIYYGVGKTHKEPKRTDYFGGLENFYPDAYINLVPEELLSNEFGIKYVNKKLTANVNYYYMKFRNEMSLTGNVGVNSISLSNINIDKSFRTGIEIDAQYVFTKLTLGTTSSFSYNRITEGEFIARPVLTPFAIVGLDADYHFTKGLYVGVNCKYNSESYIDFQNQNILPSYTVINMYAGFIWMDLEIRGNFNNISNQLILGSAYMYYDGTPRYYVMAGRNGLISLNVKF